MCSEKDMEVLILLLFPFFVWHIKVHFDGQYFVMLLESSEEGRVRVSASVIQNNAEQFLTTLLLNFRIALKCFSACFIILFLFFSCTTSTGHNNWALSFNSQTPKECFLSMWITYYQRNYFNIANFLWICQEAKTSQVFHFTQNITILVMIRVFHLALKMQ